MVKQSQTVVSMGLILLDFAGQAQEEHPPHYQPQMEPGPLVEPDPLSATILYSS